MACKEAKAESVTLFLDENVQTEAVSIHFDAITLCLERFLPRFRA